MASGLMAGNSAVIVGALYAGCDCFFGYPITPASEILQEASKFFPLVGRKFVQAESEEAAINMVYGAATAGHRVLAAENGAVGLDLALAEGPDIVLCDLQMPVMNGYEVARGLRSSPRWRVVPLVAVTAFSMRGDREKALEIGFNEHLSKPIAPETFVQQIESFLANARQTLPPSG